MSVSPVHPDDFQNDQTELQKKSVSLVHPNNDSKNRSVESHRKQTDAALPQQRPTAAKVRKPVKKLSTNLAMEDVESRDTEQNTSPNKSPKTPQKPSTPKKSKVALYIGRALLVLLLVGAVVVIFSISSSKKTGRNWPWGFWYIISFIFDQLVVLPLVSFFQSMLVYRYMFGNPGKLLVFVVEKMMSSDALNALKARRKLL